MAPCLSSSFSAPTSTPSLISHFPLPLCQPPRLILFCLSRSCGTSVRSSLNRSLPGFVSSAVASSKGPATDTVPQQRSPEIVKSRNIGFGQFNCLFLPSSVELLKRVDIFENIPHC